MGFEHIGHEETEHVPYLEYWINSTWKHSFFCSKAP